MDASTIVLSTTVATLIAVVVAVLLNRRWTQKQTASQRSLLQEWQHSLESLSSNALASNSQHFLALAEQAFKTLQSKADASLQQREQAVENLVKPIHEALEKTTLQIREIEKERAGAYGSIRQQVAMVATQHDKLRLETQRLTQALKQPQVRGRWGEITLHRLTELAGMVEYCDFEQQTTISSIAGNTLRPDLIVRLPNERIIVIDAKAPLGAYLEALETPQENEQRKLLEKHAQNIFDRVKELSAKSYARQFSQALDFVVLFVPGDQFLAAALKCKPDLIDQALGKEIILATPTSLVALLRVIAFGWREKSLAENAREIQKLSEVLCGRLGRFSQHLEAVGKGINTSVQKYNEALRSFESRLIPGVRKLQEMGVSKAKEIRDLKHVETQAASVSLLDHRDAENDQNN